MNRKAVMIISTVAVFVLTVVAAFLWLFRVRYIDVDVNRPEGDETSYEYIDDALTDKFRGKNISSVKSSDVVGLFSDNPYVKVVSVKKAFPNRLQVKVSIRSGRFLLCGTDFDYGYITDEEFFVLEKQDISYSDDRLIRVDVTDGDVDKTSLEICRIAQGKSTGLFDATVRIYNSFENGFAFVKDASIKRESVNLFVVFNMRTGVKIRFDFTDPDTEFSVLKNEICEKAAEAQQLYYTLDEDRKSQGTVNVIKTNGGVKTFWDKSQA